MRGSLTRGRCRSGCGRRRGRRGGRGFRGNTPISIFPRQGGREKIDSRLRGNDGWRSALRQAQDKFRRGPTFSRWRGALSMDATAKDSVSFKSAFPLESSRMTVLRILPPKNFRHAGNIPSWSWRDPRLNDFEPVTVLIDLRRCQFVWPSAVLWCACYGLLVRNHGRECELIVPEDLGVATYLKSTGLFSTLKEAGVFQLMIVALARRPPHRQFYRSVDLRLNLRQSSWRIARLTTSFRGELLSTT